MSSSNRRYSTRPETRPNNWQYSCSLCHCDHPLATCRKFIEYTVQQRYDTVTQRGYCRNCLARSHKTSSCPSKDCCRICFLRHHTRLHGAPQLDGNLKSVVQQASSSSSFSWNTVFVPTATVRVSKDKFDTFHSYRTLINQAAVVTRIARGAVKDLRLPSSNYRGSDFVSFNISSRLPSKTRILKINALITDELPRKLYADPITEDPAIDFTPDVIADVNPRCNAPIYLELGADVYHRIREEGAIVTSIGKVIAYQTILGYVFCGPTRNPFNI